jgi:hypothetical protein
VIKPIWTYVIELWGCASKSSVANIQRSQSKILRTTANAPWFVSNHTLHADLNILYVSDVINERINKHLNKPETHAQPTSADTKTTDEKQKIKSTLDLRTSRPK